MKLEKYLIQLTVKKLELKDFDHTNGLLTIEISCSSGTYIRSIARDFGKKLGCGAVLTKLKRTKIGDFDVKNANKIDYLVSKLKTEKIENN